MTYLCQARVPEVMYFRICDDAIEDRHSRIEAKNLFFYSVERNCCSSIYAHQVR